MIAKLIIAFFKWLSGKDRYKDQSPQRVFWGMYRKLAYLTAIPLLALGVEIAQFFDTARFPVGLGIFFAFFFWLVLYVMIPTIPDSQLWLCILKRFNNNTILWESSTSDGRQGILLESPDNQDVYLWSWDPRISEKLYHCIPYSEVKSGINLKMSPVTANPKVLNLVIHVAIKIKQGNPACIYFWGLFDRSDDWITNLEGEINTWLSDQLYRLNAQKSQVLSQYLIPTDPEQQQAVSKIVQDFLSPEIPKKWRDFLENPEVSFSIPILAAAA